ncbi:hypothetical protein UFOVP1309_65 [uncultured Caudovirales phage]|uniref:DUF2510 domain-containing protein n=1 Tax=uncultured Caudovirales phage TaxID=2100421 RepID=A0A6J5S0D6_9CAUD|nr:hypothetical protein UFOVP1309_65 [uncultured Caudovirales phage]
MTSQIWHTGKPPHIGWWNASLCRDNTIWRWWNGSNWSREIVKTETEVNAYASVPSIYSEKLIKWTIYCPKNARVPRINPETGEVTGGKK